MQAPPSSQGTLPHQESRRIVQDLFPERASIDDFRDADEAIPGAGANNGFHPVIDGGYHTVTDGIQGRQSAERGSSDTLRDEQRGITIPGETNAGYHGSSDTIKDEDKLDLRAHKDAPLAQNSSSTIGDGENQYRRTTMTHQADRASNESSRDLEKGATGAKEEQDQINQDGEDTRQAQWENNVVGWDGPNDPENPHNWKKSKKYTVTVFYASMTFCITFASSVFSTATAVTAEKYGVSTEVMTLGTSLFVFVSAFPSIIHPTLTQTTGFRRRPNSMGTLLRTLWSKDSSLFRILRLRHLSNPCRGSPKRRNNYAIPISWWVFRVLAIGDNRRNTGGLLGPC